MIYLLARYDSSVRDATTDFLQAKPHNTSADAARCEACGAPVAGLRWESPLRVELETLGSKYGDLAFGPSDSFLVSECFRDLWKDEGLLGLSGFEPVEVVKYRHRGKQLKTSPPKYFRVLADRSVVLFDPVKSGVEWVEPPTCAVCLSGIIKGWHRIVLCGEPKEDLFMARGHAGDVLASERFRRFSEEHRLANCPLIPCDQASRWFDGRGTLA